MMVLFGCGMEWHRQDFFDIRQRKKQSGEQSSFAQKKVCQSHMCKWEGYTRAKAILRKQRFGIAKL
jgi:hypothetical protein